MSDNNYIKTYSKLLTFTSFKDRLEYLKLNGLVGEDTFGFDRYMNQQFYKSSDWKKIRDYVIVRDCGFDLGCEDRPIFGKIIVHHLNPLSPEDIKNSTRYLLDPEYLICVSDSTHRIIHYGTNELDNKLIVREKNDTIPWRK